MTGDPLTPVIALAGDGWALQVNSLAAAMMSEVSGSEDVIDDWADLLIRVKPDGRFAQVEKVLDFGTA